MTLGLGDLAFLGSLSAGGYDADAQAYITAVEAADGQALETGVRDAINAFVVGCKADGIWSAIKASCILAGARTLNGCLVPLVGAAPTSYNFVAGDYDRETGIQGGATGKYITTNVDNADPAYGTQNNKHISVFVPLTSTNANKYYLAAGNSRIAIPNFLPDYISFLVNSAAISVAGAHVISSTDYPFIGASRSSSSDHALRARGSTRVFARDSQVPTSGVYTLMWDGASAYTNCKMAFYSIGESLDLALLDARVTTLINAFAAAIP